MKSLSDLIMLYLYIPNSIVYELKTIYNRDNLSPFLNTPNEEYKSAIEHYSKKLLKDKFNNSYLINISIPFSLCFQKTRNYTQKIKCSTIFKQLRLPQIDFLSEIGNDNMSVIAVGSISINAFDHTYKETGS